MPIKKLQGGEKFMNSSVKNMHDKLFSKLLPYHELLVTIVINWTFISSKDWKNNVILIMGKLPRLGFWLSHLFLRQRCQAMVQRREMGKTQGSYWVNKLKSPRMLRWLSLQDRMRENKHVTKSRKLNREPQNKQRVSLGVAICIV